MGERTAAIIYFGFWRVKYVEIAEAAIGSPGLSWWAHGWTKAAPLDFEELPDSSVVPPKALPVFRIAFTRVGRKRLVFI